ncbi:MAG: hypothetical protein WCD57_01065 [Acidobacteriaceae bacterium]
MNKTLISVLRLIVLVGVFVMLPLIANRSQAQTNSQCGNFSMLTFDCPGTACCTANGTFTDELDSVLPGSGTQSVNTLAPWSCGSVVAAGKCGVGCSGVYEQVFNDTACCTPTGKGCNTGYDCCSGICNSNGACAASGGGSSGPCQGGSGSGPGLEAPPGGVNCSSPIIVDVSGKGFFLTSAANGVKFDISGTGTPVQMAWTAQGASNAFLALPGSDGLVHNGKELFGNFTPQPPSSNPNGFLALAVYDLPANGGNGDSIIDSRDAIYSSLRLWIDENHDGISQPNELHTLSSLGVYSISLKYHFSRKEDQYGNLFRFRSRVNPHDPNDDSEVGPTAYDVFFHTATNINYARMSPPD